MTSRPWLPLAAVAVTLLLWSSAFVAIRHLGPTYSPGGLSLGRLLVGSIALGVVVLFRGGHRPARRDWPGLVAIGLLWYGLYNVTLNAGERRVDAGTAAMLIQLSPVLVAALATLFLRERATAWLWVGLVVAFAGVALIGLSTSPGGNHDLLGVLLVLVAATAYAIALIVQKPLMARLPAVEVTWIACTVGMVACLPYAGDLVHDVGASSLADAGWVVYLGLFPTAIAFTTYAYALTHMDASRLSVTTYLVPPLTVLMAWMLLDETPPAVAYVGGVLCLVGVAVARRRPRARSEVDEAVPA
jgi:drug/metabolite transporter (DMT)-like permease